MDNVNLGTLNIDAVKLFLLNVVPDIFLAIGVLVMGWIVANLARRWIRTTLGTIGQIDDTVVPFLASIARYAILAIVLVVVLGQLGVKTASILAVLGAAGLAIGLALQGTLSNIAAGLMLLWLRPFQTGDTIQIDDGLLGKVEQINLFASQMRTRDGLFKFVPNSELWNTVITNFDRNQTRRIEIEIGIGYDDKVDIARNAILGIAENDERVLDTPPPAVWVKSLGDSAVILLVRVWVKPPDFWTGRFDLTEKFKEALDAAGIEIPFPQQVVHWIGDQPPAENSPKEATKSK